MKTNFIRRIAALMIVMLVITGMPLLGLEGWTVSADADPIPADQIESITVTPKDPVVLTENVDGSWDSSESVFEYWGYSPHEGDTCTIHCKDGRDVVFTCDSSTASWLNGSDSISVSRYNLYVGKDTLPWSPGEHSQVVYYAIGDSKWETTVPITLLPEAEGRLRTARERAKEDLDFYFLSDGGPVYISEYRAKQQQEIRDRVADAKTAIDKAETAEAVAAIYDDAEKNILKILDKQELDFLEADVRMYIEDIDEIYLNPDPHDDLYTPENRQKIIEKAKECIKRLNDLVTEANSPSDQHQYDNWDGYREAADAIRSEPADFANSLPVREDLNIEVVMSQERFTYNGRQQKPAVKIVTSDGEVLPESAYKIIWPSGMVNAGDYMIDCYLTGDYRGTNANYFYIDTAPNTLRAKGKKVTLKYKKLKKKKQTIKKSKAYTVTGAQGRVTYQLAGIDKTKYKKYFKVNPTTGNITVKKKLKKGKYELLIRIVADGGVNYDMGESYVSVFVKVK